MKRHWQLLSVFALITLLHSVVANGQTSLYKFQKVFGRSETDQLNNITLLSDSGYLLVGSTETMDMTTMTNRKDMYVIKTDAAGHIKWANIYGSAADEEAFSAEEGPNGYYIFGNSLSTTGNNSANLLHIDTAGHVIWDKLYDMYTQQFGWAIKKLNANAYVLCGKTYNGGDDFEAYLLKIDSSGNVLWGKGYNGDVGMTDVGRAFSLTSDGGFLITGDSYFIPTHDYFVLAVKTDSAGNAQWIKAYADTHNSRGLGGHELPDGGYLIGSQMVTTTASADMLLIRTDNTGNVLWSKTYGSSGMDFAHSFIKTNNGYAFIGESNSFFGTGISNAYVVKVDTAGSVTSSFTYGDTTQYSGAYGAVVTADSGLAIGATCMGYGPPLENFYLVKTRGDSSGCFESAVHTTVTDTAIAFNSFTGTDIFTTVVTDITASLDTGLNGLDTMTDSTHCFAVTVVTPPPPPPPPPPTGVQSSIVAGETAVFPNPNTGSFTIQATDIWTAGAQVKVMNALGMDVTQQFAVTPAGSTIGFKTTQVATGIYWGAHSK